MSAMLNTIVSLNELDDAYRGSWCTFIGTGGPLEDWVDGIEERMELSDLGKPTKWFHTTGEVMNAFAGNVEDGDRFPGDLTFLMFPLDGLDMSKMVMFRLTWGARWFDDIIDNMRD